MRITFVMAAASMAGGVRIIATLADHLQRLGHEVVVVSTPGWYPTVRDRVRALVKDRHWTRPAGLEPSFLDFVDVDHRFIPHRPIRESDVPDADVIVATWWETAEWIAKFSARKGSKAYFIQHYEVAMGGQPADRVDATFRLPMRKITTCRWLVDLVREKSGAHEVACVPYSVDTELFHAPPRGKQARPTVGFMYSDMPFKGTDVTLEAIAEARPGVPDLHVVCFSTHPQRVHLPLPDHAVFQLNPRQEDIRALYASCDAWLFGSRCEGFGMPIMEAMACRTPVIGTPTGAAPELLPNGGGWLLDEIGRPEMMADAIVRVAQMSDDQWRERSDAALQRVSEYDWAAATQLFAEALDPSTPCMLRGAASGC